MNFCILVLIFTLFLSFIEYCMKLGNIDGFVGSVCPFRVTFESDLTGMA